MKRIGTAIMVLFLTVLGVLIMERLFHMEMEPYYVFLLFILVSSAFGLFNHNKKV